MDSSLLLLLLVIVSRERSLKDYASEFSSLGVLEELVWVELERSSMILSRLY